MRNADTRTMRVLRVRSRDCRMRRVPLILALSATAVACDPAKFASFAVAPLPVPAMDSAQRAVFASTARVAASHGLEPVAPRVSDSGNPSGWSHCFTRSTVFLCGRTRDGEVHFQLRQSLTRRFTPWADSLRRDLLGSLRSEFGAERVWECTGRPERGPGRAGCAPPTPPDGR